MSIRVIGCLYAIIAKLSIEPLPLREISNNLELREKNVVEILQEMTTEYEDKFTSKGIKINYFEATKEVK